MIETIKALCADARGELRTAILQMADSDDKIICNRVRRAKDLLDSMDIVLRTSTP